MLTRLRHDGIAFCSTHTLSCDFFFYAKRAPYQKENTVDECIFETISTIDIWEVAGDELHNMQTIKLHFLVNVFYCVETTFTEITILILF